MRATGLALLFLAACPRPAEGPVAKEIVLVPPAPSDPTAPIIDEIRVEKDVVCEGEETLVSIRAHTPDGTDGCLHYIVGGETGQRVPLRLYESVGSDSRTAVGAFGCGNVATFVPLPPVRVRPCRTPSLRVTSGRPPVNTFFVKSFAVELLDAPGFTPVRYLWDFGDGTSAETTSPAASHDYWRMPHDAAFLQQLVTVVAEDAHGARVTGRLAMQVPGIAWEERAAGRAYVFAQPVDFGTRDASGLVSWDYLLWHHEAEPVLLHQASAERLHDNPVSADPFVPVDLAGLATIPELPPGQRVRVTFRHDFSAEPADVYCINFALAGRGPTLPARASVSLFSHFGGP